MKFIKSFKSLPLSTKRLLAITGVLGMFIALPLFIWAIVTQRFDLSKKASTGEPGVCVVVNKTIVVTPDSDTNGTCHDIQTAINAVTGDGFTILIQPGDYNIRNTINITGKNNLTIEGNVEGSVDEAWLSFNTAGWGFNISSSSGKIERLHLEGQTPNGLVSISGSADFQLGYLKAVATSSHAIDFQSSTNINIYNSEIISSAGALEVQNSTNTTIQGNKIHNSANGIALFNSTGTVIVGNLITTNSESGLYLSNADDTQINHNTINNNALSSSNAAVSLNGAITLLNFSNNLVVYNHTTGIAFSGSTFTRTFGHNDVWTNPAGNYVGMNDYTGINGNISEDPLIDFGTGLNLCLNTGSPAIYGSPTNFEVMGSLNLCGTLSTPFPTYAPSPTPSPIPTPTPVPTCVPRPACLDVVPRCEIPEPIEGWCATPTPSPRPSYCSTDPFIFNITPQTQTGIPGQTLRYNISITNNKGVECGSYTTHLIVDNPSNWQTHFGTDTFILNSNQTVNTYLDVTSATSNYVLGEQPLAFRISTEESGYLGSTSIFYQLVLHTSSPTPTPHSSPTPTPIATVTPTPRPLAGDVNADGHVNIVDIGIIIDNYRTSPPSDARADLNGDGIINIVDIGIVVDNYEF